jgi:hypothetical protein
MVCAGSSFFVCLLAYASLERGRPRSWEDDHIVGVASFERGTANLCPVSPFCPLYIHGVEGSYHRKAVSMETVPTQSDGRSADFDSPGVHLRRITQTSPIFQVQRLDCLDV